MAAPHWQTVAGFRRDPDAIRDTHLDRHVLRRVLKYARPYRWLLIGFIVTVMAGAVVSVLPPLLLRALLDTAVPEEDTALVGWLAIGAVLLAVAATALSLAQRLFSARVGEGLIHDLRVKLFDHVQRLPLSFFTRTQTGALQTRLNHDVVGAQQAVTGTLGTVASNAVNIVVTLVVMFALEWRLTLLTLAVLPAFVIPARRVGRKLQRATRESMELNADMNTIITERFNVSGALLVKLFGRHGVERDRFDEHGSARP